MGINCPWKGITPQSWPTRFHLETSQFTDSLWRFSYFAPWYHIRNLKLLFINESQIWKEKLFLAFLIFSQAFLNFSSISKTILFPNRKPLIHSVFRFCTPESNQFGMSCPKINVFLSVF